MTRILMAFWAGVAALAMSSCDGQKRAYPPGYTDEGVKLDEAGWQFFPGDDRFFIIYFGDAGPPKITINCDRSEVGNTKPEIVRQLDLVKLEVSTMGFTPLQQWPQPEVSLATGDARGSDAARLEPLEGGGTLMTFTVKGRERDRLLEGIHKGMPLTLAFAEQRQEFPGPPKSMREAFADKCRGER
jgi:hypothetical protein